jgi:hypothetical protein
MGINLTLIADPGSTIDDTSKEMVRVANFLNITTDLSFNGVVLIACPGDNPASLVKAYERELASKSNYKLARGGR